MGRVVGAVVVAQIRHRPQPLEVRPLRTALTGPADLLDHLLNTHGHHLTPFPPPHWGTIWNTPMPNRTDTADHTPQHPT